MTDLDPTVVDLARQDRERYLCALCAPQDRQNAVLALLAYNQELGAIPREVSEAMLGKIKLQWWLDALAGLEGGDVPPHPVAQALAATKTKAHATALSKLAEARNFDLDDGQPHTLSALEAYAQDSGGALHVLMARLLGADDEESLQAAHAVGTAWSLIGLMRALPYKSGASRDMLPRDATVRAVLERAAALLERARTYSPQRSARPALLVGRLADDHLKRLRGQGWDPAAREEPPAGAGAVLKIWWGKWSGRF